jgi:hypothetical protein
MKSIQSGIFVLLVGLHVAAGAETVVTVGPGAQVSVSGDDGSRVSAEATAITVVSGDKPASVSVNTAGQADVSASVNVNGNSVSAVTRNAGVRVEVRGDGDSADISAWDASGFEAEMDKADALLEQLFE